MNNRQLSKQLVVSIILVCCYQHIWAGVVMKRARDKNTTTENKEAYHATKQHKVTHQTKKITTTTTAKPNVEITTLPSDFNLDGRSAFINNHFVAEDVERIAYTSSPFYGILQQEMQTERSKPADKLYDYNNDSPQIKEDLNNDYVEAEKLPEKLIFGHNVGLFDDYEEEETSEYGSENDYNIAANFEDNQESLPDNDKGKRRVQENNAGPNIFEQSIQNKPYNSSDQNKPNESNYYSLQTNTNEATLQSGFDITKPTQHWYHNKNIAGTKSKPNNQYNTQNDYLETKQNLQYPQIQQAPTKQYLQSNPLQHRDHTNPKPLTNQNSYDKPKPQRNQKPYFDIGKTSENFLNNQKPPRTFDIQQTKPGYILNNKPCYSTSSNNAYNKTDALRCANTWTTSSYVPDSSFFPNSSMMPNFSYGNSNMPTSSPFSTTSGHNKKFKTISASVQYVSTPFADLIFKYSIGMAQHSNSKGGINSSDNQAEIFNVQNDIDAKTE